LGKNFKEVKIALKNAIDISKLDLLLRVGGVSKEGQKADLDFTFKNTIFNGGVGEKIYTEFHLYYHNKKAAPSNYSFLFYALTSDGYIDVSKEEYKDFCNTHNINIKTIDTKKQLHNVAEDSPAYVFYNRIKKSILGFDGIEET